MAVCARALLPRILVITAVWITASGTLTFAADKTLTSPRPAPKPPVATPRPTLVVPDVRAQAFVFAKGILDDNGFAWRVVGSVRGYATNRVISQTPAPGARVVDTGAPTIELQLGRGSYGQTGTPGDQHRPGRCGEGSDEEARRRQGPARAGQGRSGQEGRQGAQARTRQQACSQENPQDSATRGVRSSGRAEGTPRRD